MELRQLEYFLELGRTRSFTKAAPHIWQEHSAKILPHTKVIKGREYCMYFPLL